jgi:C1A family cysteine protease
MFNKLWIVLFIVTLCVPVFGGDTGMILVWMTPEGGFSLEIVKQTITKQDGRILTLSPEGRLLVQCSPETIESFRQSPGVRDVEPYTEAPEQPYIEGRGLGDRRPGPEEEKWIQETFTPVDEIAPNQLSRDRTLLLGDKATLAMVDNSLSNYFPPIGSQGSQGSCTGWAAAYYYNTYTQAMDENITVSTGDYNNICSPAFIYNLENDGVDLGANTASVVARLNDVGASSWNLFPYNQYNYTTWPTENAWVDALKRRTNSSFSIGHWYWGCSDAQLATIKQHLSNGHVAATRTDVYENWYNNYPDNTTGINNGVLFANSGDNVGGHAMTIVGFDDDKSYVDGGTTKYGAFLIANSWGSGWGVPNTAGGSSKGFMWVAYEFFKAGNACFGIAYYNSDRPDYRPTLYAVSGLNHTQRGNVGYRGGVGNGPSPTWSSHKSIDYDGGTSVAITDSRRVAVDLTDGVSSISFPNVYLHIAMNVHSSASGSGTITSADFYYDFESSGTYSYVSSPDPTVTVGSGSTGYAYVNFVYGTPTPTNTPTHTPTYTPTHTPTHTPTNTPTNTPIPTDTPTNTPTHTPTNTPTETPEPTTTPTGDPTNTPTPTPPQPIPTTGPIGIGLILILMGILISIPVLGRK